MILYHFASSPFSRRVRLVLAHKGLSAELRDARANPEHLPEVRRLNPMHTVPVLVDGERVIADSTAICHYLDRKVPSPPLWPAGLPGAEAFELAALADSAVGVLVDLGMRYRALHDHPSFPTVRAELVGRAQRALEALGERVAARLQLPGLQAATAGSGLPLCGDCWSAADIVVYTTTAWLEGLPARAAVFPPAGVVAGLGWSLPASLSVWAQQQRSREDIRALG